MEGSATLMLHTILDVELAVSPALYLNNEKVEGLTS